ncbi:MULTISPECIES: VOC family protein [unclassified Arthrobacter]|uniref:VOC family protein n=1 Tax=unclassified Arthrobacter TaxID=235627 RepID=UPI0014920CBF|nr:MULTISPECIES: VOC family protein [unclassified Arthrobacter]MBE0009716.1 VOC family protein [Arthrobacter sp. AET 35A]NOJ59941.1 VOC family protein [Arthrobacter sp. 260]NOJ63592.1 VOC family protein [Arthrobacter sp. 147(2020)]
MSVMTTCLWFDTQAEEAAKFYVSLIGNSRITNISRYGDGAPVPADTVMTVDFLLDGVPYQGLNGGPMFQFTEAVSLVVSTPSQEETDRLWTALTADGGEESMCGWLKDRYGLSWQIVPARLGELLAGPDAEGASRTMQAMLTMRKIEISELERAYNGG